MYQVRASFRGVLGVMPRVHQGKMLNHCYLDLVRLKMVELPRITLSMSGFRLRQQLSLVHSDAQSVPRKTADQGYYIGHWFYTWEGGTSANVLFINNLNLKSYNYSFRGTSIRWVRHSAGYSISQYNVSDHLNLHVLYVRPRSHALTAQYWEAQSIYTCIQVRAQVEYKLRDCQN